MKKFLYCRDTDGGMDVNEISSATELICLYGWMQRDCAVEDKLLSLWMVTAEAGDYQYHRLGVCIRVKDIVE